MNIRKMSISKKTLESEAQPIRNRIEHKGKVGGRESCVQENSQIDLYNSRFLFDEPKARTDIQTPQKNSIKNMSHKACYDVSNNNSNNPNRSFNSSSNSSSNSSLNSSSNSSPLVFRRDRIAVSEFMSICFNDEKIDSSRKMKPGSEGLVRHEEAVIVGSNILSSNFYREEALTAKVEQAVEAYYPSLSADYPTLLPGLNNHRANRDRHSHYRLKVATWKEENKTPSFFSNINLSINIKNTSKEKILEELELMKTENSLYFEETLFGQYIEKGSTGNYWSNGLLIIIIKELISLYRTKKRDQSGMEEMKSKLIGLIGYVFESFDFEDKVGQGVLLALGYAVEEPRVFELVLTQLLKQLYVEDKINRNGHNDRPSLLGFIANKDINFLLNEQAVKEIFKRYMKERLPKCGIARGGDNSLYFKGDNIFCHVLMSMRVVGLEEVVLGVEEVLGEEEERNRYREYEDILRILIDVGFGVEDLSALKYDVWNGQTGKEKLHGWMLLEKVMGEQVWDFLNPSNSEGCDFLKGIVMSFLYEVEDSVRSEKEYQDFFIKASVDKNGYSLLDLYQMNDYIIQCKNKNLFLYEDLARAIGENIVARNNIVTRNSKEEGRNAVELGVSSKKLGQRSERVLEEQSSESLAIEAIVSNTSVAFSGDETQEALTGAHSNETVKLVLKPRLQEELMSLWGLYLKKCCEVTFSEQVDVETIGECLEYLIEILGIKKGSDLEALLTEKYVNAWLRCKRKIDGVEDALVRKKTEEVEHQLVSKKIDGSSDDLERKMLGQANKVMLGRDQDGDKKNRSNDTKKIQKAHDPVAGKGAGLLERLLIADRDNRAIAFLKEIIDRKEILNDILLDWYQCDGIKLFIKTDGIPQQTLKGNKSKSKALRKKESNKKCLAASNSWQVLQKSFPQEALEEVLKEALKEEKCYQMKYLFRQDRECLQNGIEGREGRILKYLWSLEGGIKGEGLKKMVSVLFSEEVEVEKLEVEASQWGSFELWEALFSELSFHQFKKLLLKKEGKREGRDGTLLILKGFREVLLRNRNRVEQYKKDNDKSDWNQFFRKIFIEDLRILKEVLLAWTGNTSREEVLAFSSFLKDLGEGEWLETFEETKVILKYYEGVDWGDAEKIFSSEEKSDVLCGIKMLLPKTCHKQIDDNAFVDFLSSLPDVMWGPVVEFFHQSMDEGMWNFGLNASEIMNKGLKRRVELEEKDFLVLHDAVAHSSIEDINHHIRNFTKEQKLKALHYEVIVNNVYGIKEPLNPVEHAFIRYLDAVCIVDNVYGINEPLNAAEHASIRYIDAVCGDIENDDAVYSSGIVSNSVQNSIVNLLFREYGGSEVKTLLLLKLAGYPTVFLAGYNYLRKIDKVILQCFKSDPDNMKLLIKKVMKQLDTEGYWEVFLNLLDQAILASTSFDEEFFDEDLKNQLIQYVDKNFSEQNLYLVMYFLNKVLLHNTFKEFIPHFWSRTSENIKLWLLDTALKIFHNNPEKFFNYWDPFIKFTKEEDWDQQTMSIIELVNQQSISVYNRDIQKIPYSEKRVFIDRACFVLEVAFTSSQNSQELFDHKELKSHLIQFFKKMWNKQIQPSSEEKNWLADYVTLAMGIVRIAEKFSNYNFLEHSENIIQKILNNIDSSSGVVVLSCGLKGFSSKNHLRAHYEIWSKKLVDSVKDLTSLRRNVAVIECMKKFFSSDAYRILSVVEQTIPSCNTEKGTSIIKQTGISQYDSKIAECNELLNKFFSKKISIAVPCCTKHYKQDNNNSHALDCYFSLCYFSAVDYGSKDWFFRIIEFAISDLKKDKDIIDVFRNIFSGIKEKENNNTQEVVTFYIQKINCHLKSKKVSINKDWIILFERIFLDFKEKPIIDIIRETFYSAIEGFIGYGKNLYILKELMYLYNKFSGFPESLMPFNHLKKVFELFIKKLEGSGNNSQKELLCALFFARILEVQAKEIDENDFLQKMTAYIEHYSFPAGAFDILSEYFFINNDKILIFFNNPTILDNFLLSILKKIKDILDSQIKLNWNNICNDSAIISFEKSWGYMLTIIHNYGEYPLLERFVDVALPLENANSKCTGLTKNLLEALNLYISASSVVKVHNCLRIFLYVLQSLRYYPEKLAKNYFNIFVNLLHLIGASKDAKEILENLPLYLIREYSFILSTEQKISTLGHVVFYLKKNKNFSFEKSLKWVFALFDGIILETHEKGGKTLQEIVPDWKGKDLNSISPANLFEKFLQEFCQSDSADAACKILKDTFWTKTLRQAQSTTASYRPPAQGVLFFLLERIYTQFSVNTLWIMDQLFLSWNEIMRIEADSVYGLYNFYMKESMPIHCLSFMILTEESFRNRDKDLLLLKEMIQKFDMTHQVCDPFLEMLSRESYKKPSEERLSFFLEKTCKFFEIFKDHLDCFEQGGLSIFFKKMTGWVDVAVQEDSDSISQKRERYQEIFAHSYLSKILLLFSTKKNINTIKVETVVAFMSVIPEDFSCMPSFERLIEIALKTEAFFVSPEVDVSRPPQWLIGRDDLKVLSLPYLESFIQYDSSLSLENLEEIVTVSRSDFSWVSLLWALKPSPSIFFEVLQYAKEKEIPCFKNGNIYSSFVIKEFLEDCEKALALKKDEFLCNRTEMLKIDCLNAKELKAKD